MSSNIISLNKKIYMCVCVCVRVCAIYTCITDGNWGNFPTLSHYEA